MKLWQLTSSIEQLSSLLKLIDPDQSPNEPRLVFLNRSQVADYYEKLIIRELTDHEMWDAVRLAFRTAPTPILEITDRDFALDYFSLTDDFASARLRAALDQGVEVIEYRSVDLTRSLPTIRKQDYAAFQVVSAANPFDPERMPGRVRPVRQEDGTLRDEWIVELPDPKPGMVSEIHFRDDFVPPAPIFRAIGTQFTLATDDLAEQVMRAGITDMAFMDISGRQEPGSMILRELR